MHAPKAAFGRYLEQGECTPELLLHGLEKFVIEQLGIELTHFHNAQGWRGKRSELPTERRQWRLDTFPVLFPEWCLR